jgi:hypothetical protein
MRILKTYQKGEIIGNFNIVFLNETPSHKYGYANLRYADFRCHCGKIFNTLIERVNNNRAKSCGCLKLSLFIKNATTHGMSSDPIYNVWKAIKERTLNRNHKAFENWGGRGITIFPPWIHDFQLFYDYVSCLPHFKEKGYSIDRIDNDGNYEPGNLRWTTRHIQNINKRPWNSTGYIGVYQASKNSWSFSVGDYKEYGFPTLNSAIITRNNYIVANNLEEYKIHSVKH